MRHLLFALMIALLPLRGWVGDAMALDMAVMQLQSPAAMKSVADHGHMAKGEGAMGHETPGDEPAPALHDCAGQADGGNAPVVTAHCDSCSACQACHTVALAPQATDRVTVLNALALPHAAAAHFASADAALGLKPPIS